MIRMICSSNCHINEGTIVMTLTRIAITMLILILAIIPITTKVTTTIIRALLQSSQVA